MRELELYMKRPVPVESASALIDEKIKELGDWRGKTLAKVREIIHQADPEIVEEWKWAKLTSPGTPVWSHGGIVCTGETYKNVVKMTFAKGAALKDPSGLFNSSLDGNARRAIDINDHLVRAVDLLEAHRDLLTGSLDIYLSAVANRTNEVVKVLTIYGTLALPLVIITGFFGMNLHLPWGSNPHGIWYVSGLMALSIVVVLAYSAEAVVLKT